MPSESFKRSYKTKTRESLPVAVYNSGLQQCDPGYTWGPGLRDHCLIHHVTSGKGVFRVEDAVYAGGAGDTFLVYPGTVVSYTADVEDPWGYCWVGFNGPDAKILLTQTPFTREQPVVRFSDPDAVRDAIQSIYAASGTSSASELRAIGQLYLFLALLVEQGGQEPSGDLMREYFESAVRFITHNYSHPIDVGDIASNVGISRSHLYRVFMQEVDVSPNDYLTRFRVTQACELLERSTLSMAEVAASVGYSDQLYFSRVFKKVIGLPPTQYKQQKLQTRQGGILWK